MSEELIKAEKRTEFGKGAARRIRRADKVPAVLYGHGNEPVHLTLPGHDTMLALKHGGANAVLHIDIDGVEYLGLTKQIQADPIKGFLEHLDFVEVKKGEKVQVDVPVVTVGDAKPEVLIVTEYSAVTIEADALAIPESFEVDIEALEVGDQILASQLVLPKGSTLITEEDVLVINATHAPTADEIEAELEEAEAEAGIEREESDEEIAEREEAEGESADSDDAEGDSEESSKE
ncbi:50S ribosomal protein L25/general stress protein Ctc [Alteromonas gracilis]